MQRHRAETIAFGQPQESELCIADAGGILQHRIEDRFELAGRRTDDLQHLRGRGLLLQRFAEIAGALAQLVEQPRVLDGDDGLGREVLHQLDLLVGERAYLLAVDDDCADQFVILKHRHRDMRLGAAKPDRRSLGVGAMNHLLRLQDAIKRAGRSKRPTLTLEFVKSGRCIE